MRNRPSLRMLFDPRISRRMALKQAAAGACGLLGSSPARGQRAGLDGKRRVLSYLETLARPDGGYAWRGQPVSHLSATFAAVGCFQLLGCQPPAARACADFVRAHHPARWKRLEQEHREFDYQQLQTLVWLGEETDEFAETVRSWTAPVPYLPQYERNQHPVFRFQLAVFVCRQLLGLSVEETPQPFIDYLISRRRGNGSFNNTPADDGSDGDVLDTWWGIEALHLLGRSREQRKEAIDWLRACQSTDGGFRRQPDPEFAVGSDVAYTWAALRALNQLGAEPARPAAARQFLNSLQNDDGGFGDRPGWNSNAVATRFALQALDDLGSLADLPAASGSKKRTTPAIPSSLRVFSIQIESHGVGSPTEAVELAGALNIHLWGAKNASPEWLRTAQTLADARNVPVRFFVANEEYGTWIRIPGFGTYSHLSDVIAPAGVSSGASLAGERAATWEEFRAERLRPLQQAAGQLIWQFNENEELSRALLDDSIERGGYAAISTFHFGNPDFTNSEPFLNRYRGRIPFIALQDAHGGEPWWFADRTTGMRTLFLAEEPTWDGWQAALRRNYVAAVRCDEATGQQLRMHAGSDELAEFFLARERDWRWWENPRIARPLVSLVAVRPDDQFEVGRPERGVTIRVRCAWTSTTQGQPKSPLAELKELRVDGERVEPALFTPPGRRGAAFGDHAFLYAIPEIAAGPHVATARVRRLSDGREEFRELEFLVGNMAE